MCQSDHMYEWLQALERILIIEESAVTVGLTASEQMSTWQRRIRSLEKVPSWILEPITKAEANKGTTWAQTMAAGLIVGASGQLTILGHGPTYRGLNPITGFSALIHALFVRLWDHNDMPNIIDTEKQL